MAKQPDWRPDDVSEGFEATTLAMADDYEGKVTATLLRQRSPEANGRAVLYIHGYCDYFFQTHVATEFIERGWDFYAVDLRKHGRSLQAHQTPNFCRDIDEYFEDITAAIEVITDVDGATSLLLMGHSTGGLTSALYLSRGSRRDRVDALVLNSPFLEFNLPSGVGALMPVVASLGRRYPLLPLGRLPAAYGQSIHRSVHGQWSYDLAWKPIEGFPTRAGWVRSIRRAHRQIHDGLVIEQPILLLRSTRSVRPTRARPADGAAADLVLDVADMVRYGPRLGRDVRLVAFDGALHDVMLSAPSVRANVLATVFDWWPG